MRHTLRDAFPVLARWLHTVALGLWLGGLLAIGALVAPTAFHTVRLDPAFVGNPTLQARIAGGIVGGSLRPFGVLCDVCGVLLLLSSVLLRPFLPRPARTWAALGMLVTLLLLGTSLDQGLVLFPAMDAAQARGDMSLFDTLHHRYERLSTLVQFPLLLVLALLAALRDGNPVRPLPKQ